MPFACKYCGEEFERQTDLMNHVKSDHKEEKKKEKEQKMAEANPTGGGEGDETPKEVEEPIYKPVDPRDIMLEVVRGPLANLNERQIAELLDIAEDYDGLLSPDMFERIVVNFENVGPKKAVALKERYTVKLNKAQDRLSVAHANKLGLLRDDNPNPYRRYQDSEQDIGEMVKAGIAEGIQEGRKGLSVDNDMLAKPLAEAFSNMAQTTGLVNRFLNRVVLTAYQEEARSNPKFRKQILDNISGLMPGIKGKSEDVAAGEKGKSEEEGKKGEGVEEEVESSGAQKPTLERREPARKERNIFNELDEYFAEDTEDF